MNRCFWVGEDELMIKYHDEEWGVPLHDDCKHFELLTLEGAQAGLSWYTILKKRENYRKLFDDFDLAKIVRYNSSKITELLNNTGIVRNKLKVNSVVRNAKVFLSIQEEFGSFDNYVWSFVNHCSKINYWKNINEIPVNTSESDALSKDLKKRGMNFVGSTIIYSYMQAAGLVNDHMNNCFKK